MSEFSASTIIDNYKNKVKELVQDPNPGHKAIVVYGGYMGKTYNTHIALKEIGCDEYYPNSPSELYHKIRKDWVFNMVRNAQKGFPVLILDSFHFPHSSCKKKVPEYKELIKSISEDKFGFNLSKSIKVKLTHISTDNKETTDLISAQEGFFKIKSNLIFLVGYSEPKDLINIMPSFNFNFTNEQLLLYIRENVDSIFPELDFLTHENRLEIVDSLTSACEKHLIENLNFGLIRDAFGKKYIQEKKSRDNI